MSNSPSPGFPYTDIAIPTNSLIAPTTKPDYFTQRGDSFVRIRHVEVDPTDVMTRLMEEAANGPSAADNMIDNGSDESDDGDDEYSIYRSFKEDDDPSLYSPEIYTSDPVYLILLTLLLHTHDSIQDLTCRLCLGLLNRPLSLPCFHSFCEECVKNFLAAKAAVKKYEVRNKFNCPLCKIEVTLRGCRRDPVLFKIVSIVRNIHFLLKQTYLLIAKKEAFFLEQHDLPNKNAAFVWNSRAQEQQKNANFNNSTSGSALNQQFVNMLHISAQVRQFIYPFSHFGPINTSHTDNRLMNSYNMNVKTQYNTIYEVLRKNDEITLSLLHKVFGITEVPIPQLEFLQDMRSINDAGNDTVTITRTSNSETKDNPPFDHKNSMLHHILATLYVISKRAQYSLNNLITNLLTSAKNTRNSKQKSTQKSENQHDHEHPTDYNLYQSSTVTPIDIIHQRHYPSIISRQQSPTNNQIINVNTFRTQFSINEMCQKAHIIQHSMQTPPAWHLLFILENSTKRDYSPELPLSLPQFYENLATQRQRYETMRKSYLLTVAPEDTTNRLGLKFSQKKKKINYSEVQQNDGNNADKNPKNDAHTIPDHELITFEGQDEFNSVYNTDYQDALMNYKHLLSQYGDKYRKIRALMTHNRYLEMLISSSEINSEYHDNQDDRDTAQQHHASDDLLIKFQHSATKESKLIDSEVLIENVDATLSSMFPNVEMIDTYVDFTVDYGLSADFSHFPQFSHYIQNSYHDLDSFNNNNTLDDYSYDHNDNDLDDIMNNGNEYDEFGMQKTSNGQNHTKDDPFSYLFTSEKQGKSSTTSTGRKRLSRVDELKTSNGNKQRKSAKTICGKIPRDKSHHYWLQCNDEAILNAPIIKLHTLLTSIEQTLLSLPRVTVRKQKILKNTQKSNESEMISAEIPFSLYFDPKNGALSLNHYINAFHHRNTSRFRTNLTITMLNTMKHTFSTHTLLSSLIYSTQLEPSTQPTFFTWNNSLFDFDYDQISENIEQNQQDKNIKIDRLIAINPFSVLFNLPTITHTSFLSDFQPNFAHFGSQLLQYEQNVGSVMDQLDNDDKNGKEPEILQNFREMLKFLYQMSLLQSPLTSLAYKTELLQHINHHSNDLSDNITSNNLKRKDFEYNGLLDNQKIINNMLLQTQVPSLFIIALLLDAVHPGYIDNTSQHIIALITVANSRKNLSQLTSQETAAQILHNSSTGSYFHPSQPHHNNTSLYPFITSQLSLDNQNVDQSRSPNSIDSKSFTLSLFPKLPLEISASSQNPTTLDPQTGITYLLSFLLRNFSVFGQNSTSFNQILHAKRLIMQSINTKPSIPSSSSNSTETNHGFCDLVKFPTNTQSPQQNPNLVPALLDAFPIPSTYYTNCHACQNLGHHKWWFDEEQWLQLLNDLHNKGRNNGSGNKRMRYRMDQPFSTSFTHNNIKKSEQMEKMEQLAFKYQEKSKKSSKNNQDTYIIHPKATSYTDEICTRPIEIQEALFTATPCLNPQPRYADMLLEVYGFSLFSDDHDDQDFLIKNTPNPSKDSNLGNFSDYFNESAHNINFDNIYAPSDPPSFHPHDIVFPSYYLLRCCSCDLSVHSSCYGGGGRWVWVGSDECLRFEAFCYKLLNLQRKSGDIRALCLKNPYFTQKYAKISPLYEDHPESIELASYIHGFQWQCMYCYYRNSILYYNQYMLKLGWFTKLANINLLPPLPFTKKIIFEQTITKRLFSLKNRQNTLFSTKSDNFEDEKNDIFDFDDKYQNHNKTTISTVDSLNITLPTTTFVSFPALCTHCPNSLSLAIKPLIFDENHEFPSPNSNSPSSIRGTSQVVMGIDGPQHQQFPYIQNHPNNMRNVYGNNDMYVDSDPSSDDDELFSDFLLKQHQNVVKFIRILMKYAFKNAENQDEINFCPTNGGEKTDKGELNILLDSNYNNNTNIPSCIGRNGNDGINSAQNINVKKIEKKSKNQKNLAQTSFFITKLLNIINIPLQNPPQHINPLSFSWFDTITNVYHYDQSPVLLNGIFFSHTNAHDREYSRIYDISDEDDNHLKSNGKFQNNRDDNSDGMAIFDQDSMDFEVEYSQNNQKIVKKRNFDEKQYKINLNRRLSRYKDHIENRILNLLSKIHQKGVNFHEYANNSDSQLDGEISQILNSSKNSKKQDKSHNINEDDELDQEIEQFIPPLILPPIPERWVHISCAVHTNEIFQKKAGSVLDICCKTLDKSRITAGCSICGIRTQKTRGKWFNYARCDEYHYTGDFSSLKSLLELNSKTTKKENNATVSDKDQELDKNSVFYNFYSDIYPELVSNKMMNTDSGRKFSPNADLLVFNKNKQIMLNNKVKHNAEQRAHFTTSLNTGNVNVYFNALNNVENGSIDNNNDDHISKNIYSKNFSESDRISWFLTEKVQLTQFPIILPSLLFNIHNGIGNIHTNMKANYGNLRFSAPKFASDENHIDSLNGKKNSFFGQYQLISDLHIVFPSSQDKVEILHVNSDANGENESKGSKKHVAENHENNAIIITNPLKNSYKPRQNMTIIMSLDLIGLYTWKYNTLAQTPHNSHKTLEDSHFSSIYHIPRCNTNELSPNTSQTAEISHYTLQHPCILVEKSSSSKAKKVSAINLPFIVEDPAVFDPGAADGPVHSLTHINNIHDFDSFLIDLLQDSTIYVNSTPKYTESDAEKSHVSRFFENASLFDLNYSENVIIPPSVCNNGIGMSFLSNNHAHAAVTAKHREVAVTFTDLHYNPAREIIISTETRPFSDKMAEKSLTSHEQDMDMILMTEGDFDKNLPNSSITCSKSSIFNNMPWLFEDNIHKISQNEYNSPNFMTGLIHRPTHYPLAYRYKSQVYTTLLPNSPNIASLTPFTDTTQPYLLTSQIFLQFMQIITFLLKIDGILKHNHLNETIYSKITSISSTITNKGVVPSPSTPFTTASLRFTSFPSLLLAVSSNLNFHNEKHFLSPNYTQSVQNLVFPINTVSILNTYPITHKCKIMKFKEKCRFVDIFEVIKQIQHLLFPSKTYLPLTIFDPEMNSNNRGNLQSAGENIVNTSLIPLDLLEKNRHSFEQILRNPSHLEEIYNFSNVPIFSLFFTQNISLTSSPLPLPFGGSILQCVFNKCVRVFHPSCAIFLPFHSKIANFFHFYSKLSKSPQYDEIQQILSLIMVKWSQFGFHYHYYCSAHRSKQTLCTPESTVPKHLLDELKKNMAENAILTNETSSFDSFEADENNTKSRSNRRSRSAMMNGDITDDEDDENTPDNIPIPPKSTRTSSKAGKNDQSEKKKGLSLNFSANMISDSDWADSLPQLSVTTSSSSSSSFSKSSSTQFSANILSNIITTLKINQIDPYIENTILHTTDLLILPSQSLSVPTSAIPYNPFIPLNLTELAEIAPLEHYPSQWPSISLDSSNDFIQLPPPHPSQPVQQTKQTSPYPTLIPLIPWSRLPQLFANPREKWTNAHQFLSSLNCLNAGFLKLFFHEMMKTCLILPKNDSDTDKLLEVVKFLYKFSPHYNDYNICNIFPVLPFFLHPNTPNTSQLTQKLSHDNLSLDQPDLLQSPSHPLSQFADTSFPIENHDLLIQTAPSHVKLFQISQNCPQLEIIRIAFTNLTPAKIQTVNLMCALLNPVGLIPQHCLHCSIFGENSLSDDDFYELLQKYRKMDDSDENDENYCDLEAIFAKEFHFAQKMVKNSFKILKPEEYRELLHEHKSRIVLYNTYLHQHRRMFRESRSKNQNNAAKDQSTPPLRIFEICSECCPHTTILVSDGFSALAADQRLDYLTQTTPLFSTKPINKPRIMTYLDYIDANNAKFVISNSKETLDPLIYPSINIADILTQIQVYEDKHPKNIDEQPSRRGKKAENLVKSVKFDINSLLLIKKTTIQEYSLYIYQCLDRIEQEQTAFFQNSNVNSQKRSKTPSSPPSNSLDGLLHDYTQTILAHYTISGEVSPLDHLKFSQRPQFISKASEKFKNDFVSQQSYISCRNGKNYNQSISEPGRGAAYLYSFIISPQRNVEPNVTQRTIKAVQVRIANNARIMYENMGRNSENGDNGVLVEKSQNGKKISNCTKLLCFDFILQCIEYKTFIAQYSPFIAYKDNVTPTITTRLINQSTFNQLSQFYVKSLLYHKNLLVYPYSSYFPVNYTQISDIYHPMVMFEGFMNKSFSLNTIHHYITYVSNIQYILQFIQYNSSQPDANKRDILFSHGENEVFNEETNTKHKQAQVSFFLNQRAIKSSELHRLQFDLYNIHNCIIQPRPFTDGMHSPEQNSWRRLSAVLFSPLFMVDYITTYALANILYSLLTSHPVIPQQVIINPNLKKTQGSNLETAKLTENLNKSELIDEGNYLIKSQENILFNLFSSVKVYLLLLYITKLYYDYKYLIIPRYILPYLVFVKTENLLPSNPNATLGENGNIFMLGRFQSYSTTISLNISVLPPKASLVPTMDIFNSQVFDENNPKILQYLLQKHDIYRELTVLDYILSSRFSIHQSTSSNLSTLTFFESIPHSSSFIDPLMMTVLQPPLSPITSPSTLPLPISSHSSSPVPPISGQVPPPKISHLSPVNKHPLSSPPLSLNSTMLPVTYGINTSFSENIQNSPRDRRVYPKQLLINCNKAYNPEKSIPATLITQNTTYQQLQEDYDLTITHASYGHNTVQTAPNTAFSGYLYTNTDKLTLKYALFPNGITQTAEGMVKWTDLGLIFPSLFYQNSPIPSNNALFHGENLQNDKQGEPQTIIITNNEIFDDFVAIHKVTNIYDGKNNPLNTISSRIFSPNRTTTILSHSSNPHTTKIGITPSKIPFEFTERNTATHHPFPVSHQLTLHHALKNACVWIVDPLMFRASHENIKSIPSRRSSKTPQDNMKYGQDYNATRHTVVITNIIKESVQLECSFIVDLSTPNSLEFAQFWWLNFIQSHCNECRICALYKRDLHRNQIGINCDETDDPFIVYNPENPLNPTTTVINGSPDNPNDGNSISSLCKIVQISLQQGFLLPLPTLIIDVNSNVPMVNKLSTSQQQQQPILAPLTSSKLFSPLPQKSLYNDNDHNPTKTISIKHFYHLNNLFLNSFLTTPHINHICYKYLLPTSLRDLEYSSIISPQTSLTNNPTPLNYSLPPQEHGIPVSFFHPNASITPLVAQTSNLESAFDLMEDDCNQYYDSEFSMVDHTPVIDRPNGVNVPIGNSLNDTTAPGVTNRSILTQHDGTTNKTHIDNFTAFLVHYHAIPTDSLSNNSLFFTSISNATTGTVMGDSYHESQPSSTLNPQIITSLKKCALLQVNNYFLCYIPSLTSLLIPYVLHSSQNSQSQQQMIEVSKVAPNPPQSACMITDLLRTPYWIHHMERLLEHYTTNVDEEESAVEISHHLKQKQQLEGIFSQNSQISSSNINTAFIPVITLQYFIDIVSFSSYPVLHQYQNRVLLLNDYRADTEKVGM